jgi:hypothetical protein
MRISLVRRRLAAAVESVAVTTELGEIVRLACFGYVPDAVVVPCFYAGEVTIDPLVTFGTADNADITCRVLTSHSDDAQGQYLLDELLRRSGASSVRAALQTARGAPGEYALDGACDDFVVRAVQGYRLYRVGDTPYFGAELVIRAHGNGDED